MSDSQGHESVEGGGAGSGGEEARRPSSVGPLPRHQAELPVGQVVAEKYAIQGLLGVGGFGTVYRAIQQPVGRSVALKVVHPRHAHDPQLRARFFREAKLVAQLNDRSVVTLHDYGESPEVGLYMAFELVEGATLAALIREGPQPPERVANILLQLLRALSEAHAQGMIHRDLKPANIMLVEESGAPYREGVRLLDFGIAKLKVEVADQDPSLATQQGLLMGTPSYISPEQARANGPIDGRSDLYSLAVVAYALLAGKNPFVGTSVVETILAHCNTMPPPFEERLRIPPLLEAAIRKALQKSPEDRFASAMQMAAAIEAGVPSLTSGIFGRPWSSVAASVDTTSPSGFPAAAVHMMAQHPPQGETWSQPMPDVDPRRPLKWALLLLLLIGAGVAIGWTLMGLGSDASRVVTLKQEDPMPSSVPVLPAEEDQELVLEEASPNPGSGRSGAALAGEAAKPPPESEPARAEKVERSERLERTRRRQQPVPAPTLVVAEEKAAGSNATRGRAKPQRPQSPPAAEPVADPGEAGSDFSADLIPILPRKR